MNFDGMPHPNSFYRDCDYPQVAEAKVRNNRIKTNSGMYGLTVFKSTGSQFHEFKPLETMTFVRVAAPRFDEAWFDVRDTTVNIFAQENSHSVQNTILLGLITSCKLIRVTKW
ncbi:Uricase [Golovinomyces cichoracearum]|uniref:factor independent urate hydroxylase n=1 Tax=Golovinomyces cichoracearum TaxID=62708 RepID=A0A420IYG5_9PEZI|nr:Uricase [Golovinomyces cichoracearum]